MHFDITIEKSSETVLSRIKKDLITSLFALPVVLLIYFFLLSNVPSLYLRNIISLVVVVFPISAVRVYRKLIAKPKPIVETKDDLVLPNRSLYIKNTNEWGLSANDLIDSSQQWNKLFKIKIKKCHSLIMGFRKTTFDEGALLNDDPTQLFTTIAIP